MHVAYFCHYLSRNFNCYCHLPIPSDADHLFSKKDVHVFIIRNTIRFACSFLSFTYNLLPWSLKFGLWIYVKQFCKNAFDTSIYHEKMKCEKEHYMFLYFIKECSSLLKIFLRHYFSYSYHRHQFRVQRLYARKGLISSTIDFMIH